MTTAATSHSRTIWRMHTPVAVTASPTHLLTLLENFSAPDYRTRAPRDQNEARPRLVPKERVNFAQDGGGDGAGGDTYGAATGVQLYIDASTARKADEPQTEPATSPLPHSAGVKPPTTDRMICRACGSTAHNLDTCPEVSDEVLAEILLQLDEVSPEGTGTGMLQKEVGKAKKSRRHC
jgi:hypothetical protein